MAIQLYTLLFALVVALMPAATRAAADAPAPAHSDCAAQDPIRLGGLDWESGQITTALLDLLLREGLGCRTEVVPGSVPSLESALIQDDIQIIAEQWVGRSPGIEKAVADKKVAILGDTLTGGAVQGWYVPRYVQEQNPDLKSVDDLASHAHLFPNPEQPGQARFLNCPAGWACETFNTRLLANTGLSKRYANVHPGTGAALDAEIASAIARREPLLFYYWHPAGLMAKYDLVPIAFPDYDARCWPELMNPASRDRCVSGFPVSRLAMAVSDSLQKQYPQVVALIRKLQLSPEVLDRLILDMTENRRDGPAQARLFLQQRPELWTPWLSAEAAQRVARRLGIDATRLPGQKGATEAPAASDRAEASGPEAFFPAWSVADWLNDSLARLVSRHGESFRAFSQSLLHGLLLPLERALGAVPPWLLLALLALRGRRQAPAINRR